MGLIYYATGLQHKYRKGLYEKIYPYFTRTVLDLRELTVIWMPAAVKKNALENFDLLDFWQLCRILLWLKKKIWSLKLQMKHVGGSC